KQRHPPWRHDPTTTASGKTGTVQPVTEGSVDDGDSNDPPLGLQGPLWRRRGMLDRDRFVVDDAAWEKVAPLLPGKPTDPGATGKDNRLFLEAVLWRVRTGVPWR